MKNSTFDQYIHELELVLSSIKLVHHEMYTEDSDVEPIDLEQTLEMAIGNLDKTIDKLYKLNLVQPIEEQGKGKEQNIIDNSAFQ